MLHVKVIVPYLSDKKNKSITDIILYEEDTITHATITF